MTIKQLKDFFFETFCRLIGFTKESSYYSVKHQKKKVLLFLASKLIKQIPDASNSKEHYQLFLKNKNKKSVKLSKVITQQPKLLKNSNIVGRKLVAIDHPKSSNKLFKTISQAK